ncbi:MAG: hypothetical protein JWN44_1812 [Myxococcales bacterium]|nr:hypothetical protein [Myxococcales bacterium]
MGHQYGMSRASVFNEAGEFEAALEASTQEITRESDNAEHYWDRASALSSLERYDEAVAEFERAKLVDTKLGVLDDDMLDDAYFSALLGAARQEKDIETGCEKLRRYLTVFPAGRHVTDTDEWQRRLRGELKSKFVKERLE